MNITIRDMVNALEQAQEQIAELEQVCGSLDKELTEKTRALEAAHRGCSEATRKFRDLRQTADALIAADRAREQAIERYKTEVERLESACDGLEILRRDLESENRGLAKAVRKAEGENRELREKLGRLHTSAYRVLELETETETLRKELGLRVWTIQQLETKIREQARVIRILRNDVEDLKNDR